MIHTADPHDRGDEGWPHPFGYAYLPDVPPAAPRRGRGIGRWLGAAVFGLLGWRLEGRFPDTSKLVLAGGPHTSNWDAIIGIAAILKLRLDIRVMAKHTAFRGPIGWILRAIGGIPVDRSARRGVTAQMVERFQQTERLYIGVTPEGTRSKVDEWKTGFYRIADGAGVPILPVALDFGRKTIRVGTAFHPTGDMEADFERIRGFFATAEGKRSENF